MAVSITLRQLDLLQQLYNAGFQDAFLDNALRKMIAHQIARDEADLQRVDETLTQIEKQYGLTSDDFAKRYQAGQASDTADALEWTAFYKMRQRLVARLNILRDNGKHE